jgi:hypothetical protein
MQMNVRASEQFAIRERSRVWLYEQFCSLFKIERTSATAREKMSPTPSSTSLGRSTLGGVSGTSAIPSLRENGVDQFLIVRARWNGRIFPANF